MRAIDSFKQKKWMFIVVFITIGAFMLTACGTNSSSHTTTGAGTGTKTASAPSPTPTIQTVQGYGTTYGCPGDAVVSAASAPANVIVRPGLGHTTFSAQPDNVVEVQMPFGIAWHSPVVSSEVLQSQAPAGYVWKPANACIWHYVAKNAGTVKLTFFGTVLCKTNLHCALAEVINEFTIKVG